MRSRFEKLKFKPAVLFIASLVALFLIAPNDVARGADGREQARIRYARHFKIAYLGQGYKLVSDGAGRRLLLCPRGNKPLPGYENLPAIEIPVGRVALNSSMNAAFLRPLGLLDSVAGICIDGMGSQFDSIKKRIAEGKMVYLGNGNPMDYERLGLLQPEIVFARDWNSKLVPLLEELNIPVAVVDCFQEKHPLAEMEWVKFLAAFYNMEAEANRFFEKAVRKVEAISAKTASAGHKPKILSGGFYHGKVHVPRADSCLAEIITYGGGDYVFKGLKPMEYMVGYGTITMEEFYVRAKEADLYILEASPRHGITSMRQLAAEAELLLDLKPVRQGKVWLTRPGYWEALDRLDAVIEEVAAIIHPRLFPGHELTFFQKLPAE